FSRIICGSNFVADSLAGMGLGLALSTFSLTICRVPLRFPSLHPYESEEWHWPLLPQGATSGGVLLLLFFAGGFWLWNSPAHGNKVRVLMSSETLAQSTAVAAPKSQVIASLHSHAHDPNHLSSDIIEGEGAGQQFNST